MRGNIIGFFNGGCEAVIAPFHIHSPESVYKRIKIRVCRFLLCRKRPDLLISIQKRR